MSSCASCKWWDEDSPRTGGLASYHTRKGQLGSRWGVCLAEGSEQAPFVADAADEYGVQLVTREDFVCVCWASP